MTNMSPTNLKPNELLLAAVGQVMQKYPNANELQVRTTIYSKHPDAARLLAKTSSYEAEAKIVSAAIRAHKRLAGQRSHDLRKEQVSKKTVWIG